MQNHAKPRCNLIILGFEYFPHCYSYHVSAEACFRIIMEKVFIFLLEQLNSSAGLRNWCREIAAWLIHFLLNARELDNFLSFILNFAMLITKSFQIVNQRLHGGRSFIDFNLILLQQVNIWSWTEARSLWNSAVLKIHQGNYPSSSTKTQQNM